MNRASLYVFFMHSQASIGAPDKILFEFWKHHPFQSIVLMKIWEIFH